MRFFLILILFCGVVHSQEFNETLRKSSEGKIIPQKIGFGSQFYNYYKINVLGIEYNYLYLSDDKKIEVVTTKDPKFTINGKNYWNISYKDFSEEIKGYSLIYGFHFVKFDNGWFGCYGKYQPPHLIENNKPLSPDDEKPSFFVKINLLE